MSRLAGAVNPLRATRRGLLLVVEALGVVMGMQGHMGAVSLAAIAGGQA